MRHQNTKAILNRPADQRKALIRNLLTSLFLEGSLQTTDAKGKALVSEVEKLITRVKQQKDIHNAIRSLNQVIFTEAASKKALTFIQNTLKTSGFTRLVKVGTRAGDCATVVQVELIQD